jgi:hypothetical protein
MNTEELLRQLAFYYLIAMGIGLVLAAVLFIFAYRQVRRMNIPPDAGFAETLLLTPLVVVLFVDMLDLAFDFLAAPIAWVILDRMGLKALRNISALEALVPFTQVVPTMTLAWFGVRLLGRERFERDGKVTIIDPPLREETRRIRD